MELLITVSRQTEDGRVWPETTCTDWNRALSFIPNWGHIWIRNVSQYGYGSVEVIYGKLNPAQANELKYRS